MRRPRRALGARALAAVALSLLAMSSGPAGPLAAQTEIDVPTRTVARVLASAGVAGGFATPVCRHGQTLEPAQTALYTYALVRQARSADRPMVLDTGGLLAPHGVARYAAVADPDALAELVAALGYRALAFGIAELGAPRESLLAVLRGLRARGIASIATNLRCGPPSVALCDVLVDASDGISMHRVGEARTAVLAFLPADATLRVAPDLAEGIAIEPVTTALPRAVQRARRGGAQLVIAIVALPSAEALSLARALPPLGRPDLVLLPGEADVLFARPETVVPAIASPPADDALEVLVREGALREGYEMLAQPLGGRGVDVAEPVREFAERIGQGYCERWGRTLGGGRLARPIDARGLADLAASIVRAAAGADVAVLNLAAIDARWRPQRADALTASDLYLGLPYDEPVVVADVPSRWITTLAQRAQAAGLVTAGLSWDGSSARVLDRPLQARAGYRVATLRFLARGGDGILPPLPDGTRWRPLDDATLRSLVLERLQRRDERDPRDALGDPRLAPEWIVQGTIDGTFSGSSIANPAGYDATLLQRASTVALGLEVSLRADATAPNWSWENLGVLRYRAQWAPAAGGSGALQEAVDQVQVRSLGAWRGLRTSPAQVWVPDPFVELFAESELSQPTGRSWHWLLLRPTAGVRFALTNELEAKLHLGLQAQVLRPGSEAELGVGVTTTLRPWDLARIDDRHVTIGGLFDWFLVDLGDENRWQLRGNVDASFDLAGPLALTLGVRLYLQQDRGQDLGVALDATAGLRIGWLGRALGP